MAWQIIWSSFAEKQISDIHNYYLKQASLKTATKIVIGIIKAPNSLLKNPKLGQVEPALYQMSTEYRYILFRSYKIIYSLDLESNYIKIADVFDTRQNPGKLKRKK